MKERIFNLIGIKAVSFKRRLKQGDLILRLRQFRDLPVLYSLLTPEILLEANGFKPKAFDSLVSFWIWLKITFYMFYVIEVEETGHHRMIGFAALYDMNLGSSLWFSLAIFRPDDRRQRYGERTLRLLFDSLQKNGAAETVYAEVSRTNISSLSLFRKLGFEVYMEYEDRFILQKCQPFDSPAQRQGLGQG
jgi:RimJ/RimL family protein N-acetyltransferase